MQDAGYAALQIIPSFDGMQSHLERGMSGPLAAAGVSGGRRYGDSAGRSMATTFAHHARTAGLLAGAGLAVAGAAIIKLGRDSIAEARESQKVGALTAQVIKTTGGAANITAREVGNLSTTLSLKTGVDDEVIQRGANMLLTFKNVRNEVGLGNDVFNQSVQVTEDMAAAMAGGQGGGQLDLKSSSILVGKALNDPIKGLSALSRVGVSFTDQQKKNIASLIEQNKQSEAQKIILGELQSEFGGAAAAQATLGEKVSVAWGNIEEKLGTAILPLVHDVERAILHDGVPALNQFSHWFRHEGVPAIRDFARDAKPQIASFVEDVKPLAKQVLPAVATALGDIRDVAHDALPYAKDLVGAFNDMPDWAKKGVALGGLAAFAGKKTGALSLLTGGGSPLGGLVSKMTPVPVVITNPELLGLPGVPGGNGSPTSTLGKIGTGVAAVLTDIIAPLGFAMVNSNPKNIHPDTISSDGSVIDTKNVLSGSAAEELLLNRRTQAFQKWFDAQTVGYAADQKALKQLIGGTGQLGKALDGIPASKQTKYSAPGITDGKAKNSTQQLIQALITASKPRQGRMNVDTSQAEAALQRVIALQNAALSKRSALQATGVLPGGSGGGSSSTPSTPRTSSKSGRRRPRPAIVHVNGQQFSGVIQDEIQTNDDLAGERGRAGVGQ